MRNSPRRALSLVTSITAIMLMLAPLAHTQVAHTQVKPKITQAIDNKKRKELAGTVHPLTSTATDEGRVDAGLAMKDMLLTLRRSADQKDALDRYVNSLHNPNSPNFQKWLTPEEYARQFGELGLWRLFTYLSKASF